MESTIKIEVNNGYSKYYRKEKNKWVEVGFNWLTDKIHKLSLITRKEIKGSSVRYYKLKE